MLSNLFSGDYAYFFLMLGGIIFAIVLLYVLFTYLVRKQAEKNVERQRASMNTLDNEQVDEEDGEDTEELKEESEKKDITMPTPDSEPVSEKTESEGDLPDMEESRAEESQEALYEDEGEDAEEDEEEIEEPEEEEVFVVKKKHVEKPKQIEYINDDDEEKPELGRYHVLFRKEDRVWYVKREGSARIIKVLETQKEAIAYATIKAINQDTSLVIHKMDGKIRKQSY